MIGKDETTWTENENLNMETTWTENENLNMVTEHVKLNMVNWTWQTEQAIYVESCLFPSPFLRGLYLCSTFPGKWD